MRFQWRPTATAPRLFPPQALRGAVAWGLRRLHQGATVAKVLEGLLSCSGYRAALVEEAGPDWRELAEKVRDRAFGPYNDAKKSKTEGADGVVAMWVMRPRFSPVSTGL